GKELRCATLLRSPPIQQMCVVLADEGWSEFWSSLVPIQPQGHKPPFFFVHAGGGNILSYRLLAHHLGQDQPVWGLQAQGLGGAQALLASIEEMADHYLQAIRSQQPEGPYYLGGHSVGALL